MDATNTDTRQEQVDKVLEIALVATDANLARRQRAAWNKLRRIAPQAVREIEECRFLQEKLFNVAADLNMRRNKIFDGCLAKEQSEGIKL